MRAGYPSAVYVALKLTDDELLFQVDLSYTVTSGAMAMMPPGIKQHPSVLARVQQNLQMELEFQPFQYVTKKVADTGDRLAKRKKINPSLPVPSGGGA